MENLEKQLKKIFKNLHKNEERADSKWLSQTRLDLQKHMRENPAGKSAPVRSRIGSLFVKPMAVVSAVLIFLLAGGGTAMAAWSAAPGDMLYPIKLASENITIVLSVDEETKAKLHMKYADKRLEELEQISADTDAARNTDRVALDRVVENMESHIVKIGEYLETPSEPRHIAEVALHVAEFTQAQAESIKRIETRSSEIILPILPAVRQINDEQKQKVTQTLYAAREILEENIAKEVASNEDEELKQIVIKRLNILEGGELEVVDAVAEVADPKDGQDPSVNSGQAPSAGSEQVLESEVSSDGQAPKNFHQPAGDSGQALENGQVKDLPDQNSATSTEVSESQDVESSYQDDQNSSDDDVNSSQNIDGEAEPTDDHTVIIIESNYTPEIQEDTSEEITEPVVADDTADTPDAPTESNTESEESAPVENNEPNDGTGETSEETVPEEETITQESAEGEVNEPNSETVGSNTNTGVTFQTVATLPTGQADLLIK